MYEFALNRLYPEAKYSFSGDNNCYCNIVWEEEGMQKPSLRELNLEIEKIFQERDII
jgi:hypothetical protein